MFLAMSTENSSENPDPQSLLDLIDPKRIAAVSAPGLNLQLHDEKQRVEAEIAKEKWEFRKKAAAVGIRMTHLVPPGPR